jgi:hypothetical protein
MKKGIEKLSVFSVTMLVMLAFTVMIISAVLFGTTVAP